MRHLVRRMLGLGVLAGGLGAVLLAISERRRAALVRAACRFMNARVDPLLMRRGIAGREGVPLAELEHVGRRSGRVYRSVLRPYPTPDGVLFPVPLGERSQWAQNVLAAGHCRMLHDGLVHELDEPRLLAVPEAEGLLSEPLRAFAERMDWRFLRLHRVWAAPGSLGAPTVELAAPVAPVPTTA